MSTIGKSSMSPHNHSKKALASRKRSCIDLIYTSAYSWSDLLDFTTFIQHSAILSLDEPLIASSASPEKHHQTCTKLPGIPAAKQTASTFTERIYTTKHSWSELHLALQNTCTSYQDTVQTQFVLSIGTAKRASLKTKANTVLQSAA